MLVGKGLGKDVRARMYMSSRHRDRVEGEWEHLLLLPVVMVRGNLYTDLGGRETDASWRGIYISKVCLEPDPNIYIRAGGENKERGKT